MRPHRRTLAATTQSLLTCPPTTPSPHPHSPNHILPPTPSSYPPQFLSKLVNLQGIVTRCTLVRPKIMRSVHWCPATGQFTSREYRDVTAHTGGPTTTAYPTK